MPGLWVLRVLATSLSIRIPDDSALTIQSCRWASAVALSGRVPVKVSLNNGDIKIGDLLTVSDETGLVMKATEPGFVVGMALEGSDRQSEDGKITMFVNPHWTVGNLELEKDPSDTSFADDNNTWLEKFAGSIQYVLKKLGLFIKSGVATLQSVITDDITTKNIQTDTLCVGETCVSEQQLIELLQNNGTQPVIQTPDSNNQTSPVDNLDTPAPDVQTPSTDPSADEAGNLDPETDSGETIPTPEEPAPTPDVQTLDTDPSADEAGNLTPTTDSGEITPTPEPTSAPETLPAE